jgi:hypothetical protein
MNDYTNRLLEELKETAERFRTHRSTIDDGVYYDSNVPMSHEACATELDRVIDKWSKKKLLTKQELDEIAERSYFYIDECVEYSTRTSDYPSSLGWKTVHQMGLDRIKLINHIRASEDE